LKNNIKLQQFGVKKTNKLQLVFKTKLAFELLQNEHTLAEISSKHNILSQNLVNRKKVLLANVAIAMEPSKALKGMPERSEKCPLGVVVRQT
jgi:hypothetical protein